MAFIYNWYRENKNEFWIWSFLLKCVNIVFFYPSPLEDYITVIIYMRCCTNGKKKHLLCLCAVHDARKWATRHCVHTNRSCACSKITTTTTASIFIWENLDFYIQIVFTWMKRSLLMAMERIFIYMNGEKSLSY